MTSQIFLSENLSLGNLITNFFSFNKTYFFLGWHLGLDQNLDSSEILLSNCCMPMYLHYIMFFIAISPIGIILLAAPLSQILDTEADYQSRQVYKQSRPTIIVDLAYIRLPVPANSHVISLFFFDKLDPSGVQMSSLFATSGYISVAHNGIRGYSGAATGSLNQNNELPVIASPLGVHLIESRGGAILSNGLSIRKEVVSARRGSSATVTRLYLEENR